MSKISPGVPTALSTAPRKKTIPSAFPVLLCAALWMAALRSLQFQNLRAGLGLVDDYWASFYLMSYADGFRRRALIGSIFRLVEPKGANILIVNALAIIVMAALLAFFCVAFLRVAKQRTPLALGLAFAFFVSTLVCVYFEVLGDLLQMCLLLFALSSIFILRLRSTALKMAIGYSLLVLCFLIHEASIFFLAPCLPFLIVRWPRWRDFLAPAAAIVCLLAVSLVWSDLHPHLTYHAILYRHAHPLSLVVETKPFKVLLYEMYSVKFGGIKGKVRFAFKIFRIGLIAISGLVALANLLPWASLRRQIYVFLTICFFSIPLWFIAEDWGRFLCYNFTLAILIASWNRPLPQSSDQPNPTLLTDAFASYLRRIGGYTFVALAALMVLILSPFHQSRVLGITTTSIAFCMVLILAAVAQVLGWLPDPMNSSSSPATPTSSTP